MAWFILIVSGLFESVWAAALSLSHGFTRLVPSLVFLVACAISMSGLAFAMRTLPVGTSYAIWAGVGVVGALLYSFLTGAEPVSLLKVIFAAMIVGGIVGLKLV